MRKNIFIALITVILSMVVLTSCGAEKEEIVTENNTYETKIAPAIREEISSVIDDKTEMAEKIETTTEETTEKTTKENHPSSENTTKTNVPDTTRERTTAVPDVTIDFFYPTEGAVFYHNGKPQDITKEMMDKDILPIINKVTKNERFGMAKLYVDNTLTDKIKAENLCLEISFEGVHLINGLHGVGNLDGSKSQYTFFFEKVLIALDGEYKNVIFFMKDGQYRSGPIKPYNSSLSDDILAYLFD
ncbi:MAG: hypothetical protein IJ279_05865 [Clostridia bacterium]|nr:hypothetical protein [Clostridia bacterium]